MWFSSSRRRVGCLGKLPLAADFSLEARMGIKAEDTLSGWLHVIPKPEASTGHQGGGKENGGFGFFLLDSRRRTGITGRIWPSSDTAGRRFPFAIYIALDRKALKSDSAALYGRVKPAWDDLEKIVNSSGYPWFEMREWTPADASSAASLLKEAKVSLYDNPEGQKDPLHQANEMELWPFLEALFPGDSRLETARAMMRFGRFLKNFQGGGSPAVALRVPFSESHPPEAQVAFWAAWMSAALGKPAPLPEALFVPRGGESLTAGLWFLYRELLPQDGEVLFYRRQSHEYLFDLVATGKKEEDDSIDVQKLAEKLDQVVNVNELYDVSAQQAGG